MNLSLPITQGGNGCDFNFDAEFSGKKNRTIRFGAKALRPQVAERKNVRRRRED